MADASEFSSDIDALRLLYLTLQFALPLLALLIPVYAVLNHPGVNGKFRLLYVWVITHPWANPGRGAWLLFGLALAAVGALAFLLVYGITLAIDLNELFGLSVILVGLAILLVVWSIIRWAKGEWRPTSLTAAGFVAALVLTFAFEICMIFLAKPRTFFGMSAVLLSFQMMPMIALAFMIANGFVKSWDQYQGTVDKYGLSMGKFIPNVARQTSIPNPAAPGAADAKAAGGGDAKDANLLGALGEAKKDVVVAVPGADAGAAAGSAGGAAAASDASAAILPPSRVPDKHSALVMGGTYFLAVCMLVAYAVIIYALTDSDRGVGFVTLGAIVALDLVIFLCVYGGKISTAWQISTCMLLARILLIVWGAEYYFVGHCFLYFVAVVFFSWSIVESRWPRKKGVDGKVVFLRQLSVQGLALEGAAADGGSGSGGGGDAWTEFYVKFASWFDVTALALLTLGMIADTIAAKYVTSTTIDLQEPHAMYELGVVVLFCGAIVLSAMLVFRYYENKDYTMNVKLWCMTGAMYVTIVVCSVLIWVVTKSVLVLASGCFLPAIVVIGVLWWVQFSRNDYDVLLDYTKNNQAAMDAAAAANSVSKNNDDLAKLINRPEKVPETPAAAAAAKKDDDKAPAVAASASAGGADAKAADVAVAAAGAGVSGGDKKDGKQAGGDSAVASAAKAALAKDPQDGIGPNGDKHWMYNFVSCACAAHKKVPVHDVLMVAAIPLEAALIVLWGVTVALSLGDQWWIGWLVAAFVLLLICTVLPIIIWFQTFETSPLFWLCAVFAPIVLFGSAIVFFVGPPLYRELGSGALATLFVSFFYPLVVAFGLGYYKWRDDKWQLSPFVKVTFGICGVLIVTFFIVIAAVFNDVWQVGVGGLVLCIGVIASHYAIPVLRARHPRALHYFTLTVVVVVVAFAVVVAVLAKRGFIGFSIVAVCGFLYLASTAYKQHKPDDKSRPAYDALQFFYTDVVFPVFKFSPQATGANPLVDDTTRVALVYANLALVFLWGILAVYFLNPASVGLGTSSLALVLTAIYSMELRGRTQLQLKEAIDFLVEGSPLYTDVLEKAKVNAKGSQLSFKQKIGASASPLGRAPAGKGAGSADDKKHDPTSTVSAVAVSVSVPAGPAPAAAGGAAGDAKSDVKVDVSVVSTTAAASVGGSVSASSSSDNDDPDAGHLEQADSLLLEEIETQKIGDWQVLAKKANDLFAAIPPLSCADGWSCKPSAGAAGGSGGGGGAPATVTYQGWAGETKLAVHDASRLYSKLERQTDLLYHRNVKFHIHVQMELIVAANSLRVARDREMELYLRSQGRSDISLDELQTMKDTDPRKRALLKGLADWRVQQKKEADARRAAMEKKRKEEADAQAERERLLAQDAERDAEEKRRLKREEMEKLMAEQKRAEELALTEANAKQEEVRRDEFQQKAGKYEQAKRVYLDTRFKRWQREKEANRKRVEADAERLRVANAALLEPASAAAAAQNDAKRPASPVRVQEIEAEVARAQAEAAKYDEEAKRYEAEARRLEAELKVLSTHAAIVTQPAVAAQVQLNFDQLDRERRDKEEAERKKLEDELERQRKADEERRRKDEEEAAARRKKAEDERRAKEEAEAQAARDKAERERKEALEKQAREDAERMAQTAAAERAALEAEMARQRAEQDRKLREEQKRKEDELARQRAERAAALAAQQKAAEEARQKLLADQKRAAEERKRQDEEKRKKEEAERVERERQAALAAQRLREEEEAKRKALEAAKVDPKIALMAQAVRDGLCTYTVTGQSFTKGRWWKCHTCGQPDHSICETCTKVCHAGHSLEFGAESPFYCDCGDAKCNATLSPAERAAAAAAAAAVVVSKPAVVDAKTPAGVNPLDVVPVDPSIEIIAQCSAKNAKYSDREFAGQSALNGGKPKKEWADLKWKRVSELDAEAKLFVPPIDPQDIKQGSLGNCWFLAAISVLTLRPELFNRVFLTKEANKAGVYSFRFVANGKVRIVTIDDQLPVRDWGPGYKVQLAMCTSAQPHEYWPALLEKAYAKLYKGYVSLDAGFVDSALVDLTGGIGNRLDLTDDKTKKQAADGSLFNQLLEWHKSGFMLGAGSPSGSDSEANASKWGIVQGHAYSMLAVAEVDGNRLVRLRNPWGRKEWTGDWSDASPKWTKRMMAKVEYVKAEDGSFWMCWEDFQIHFEDLYVCRFFDRSIWPHQLVLNDEWKGRTAGGCTNTEKVKDTPQYALKFDEPCTIAISLMQDETRGTGAETFPIAVKVYNNGGKRISRKNGGSDVAGNPEGFYFKRQVLAQFELPVQAGAYTVLFATHAPGCERKFTIMAYGTQPFTLEHIPLA